MRFSHPKYMLANLQAATSISIHQSLKGSLIRVTLLNLVHTGNLQFLAIFLTI